MARQTTMRPFRRRFLTWILFLWAMTMTSIVIFSDKCLPTLDSDVLNLPPTLIPTEPKEDPMLPPDADKLSENLVDEDGRSFDNEEDVHANGFLGEQKAPKKPGKQQAVIADEEENPVKEEEVVKEEDEHVKEEFDKGTTLSKPGKTSPSASKNKDSWTTEFPSSSSSSSSSSSITFELTSPQSCLSYTIQSSQAQLLAARSPLLFSSQGGRDDSPQELCGLKLITVNRRSFDDTWRPLYGQRSKIRDHYEETQAILGTSSTRPALRVDTRVHHDGGIGFRVVLLNAAKSPLLAKSPGLGEDVSLAFATSINLDVGVDGTLYQDLSGENGFETHRLSEETSQGWPYSLPMHPFTVHYDNDLFFAVTEAANTEFESVKFSTPGPNFQAITATFRRTDPLKEEDLPTPWFTFVIGHSPGDLIERADSLVYNLNEPCAIQDPSWIRVGKVFRDLPLSTESSLAGIDLALKANMQHILLDASWYGPEVQASSDATMWVKQPKLKPLDLKEVLAYSKSKGVGVFLYVNDIALKRQFDKIVPLFASWGVAGIKFGFVQLDSSKDTARLMAYVRKCAEYKLLVNIHDNFRPSGYSRTYPNLVSIEGVRGDEHSETPAHSMILPFVRYLGGVADNTYVFDEDRLTKMGKSVTHQIAFSLICYNPLQHLYWYRDPWNILKIYRAPTNPIWHHLMVWKDMPGTWEQTKVIDGVIGEYLTIARQDSKGNWFVATATKEARTISFALDFLDPQASYQMERYQDNPKALYSDAVYSNGKADLAERYTAELAYGGGDVVVFKKAIPSTYEAPIDPKNGLPSAVGEFDSRLFVFETDPRNYRICTMYNTCVSADKMYFAVADKNAREELSSQVALCQNNAPNRPLFCRCFARSLQPTFVKDFEEIGSTRGFSGHTWVSDHWVNIHQIGHWVEKLVQFHSVFLDSKSYGLPDVDRIAFIKSPEMDPAESFFYSLGTGSLGYDLPEKPLFKLKAPICMEQASVSGLTATMATSQEDMMAFRKTANRLTKSNLPVTSSGNACPPPKTFILQRTEPAGRLRRMLNQDEIERLLKSKFGLVDVSVISTNSTMPAPEQVSIFGQYGLMLASHSSQLVFSIFSQPNAAIIEVASTYFNSDFSSLAQKAGLFYQFALGGEVPDTITEYTPKYCNQNFQECEGEPQCIEKGVTCSKPERGEIKELDFEAEVTEVLNRVEKALKHLHSVCGGHWNGARKP